MSVEQHFTRVLRLPVRVHVQSRLHEHGKDHRHQSVRQMPCWCAVQRCSCEGGRNLSHTAGQCHHTGPAGPEASASCKQHGVSFQEYPSHHRFNQSNAAQQECHRLPSTGVQANLLRGVRRGLCFCMHPLHHCRRGCSCWKWRWLLCKHHVPAQGCHVLFCGIVFSSRLCATDIWVIIGIRERQHSSGDFICRQRLLCACGLFEQFHHVFGPSC